MKYKTLVCLLLVGVILMSGCAEKITQEEKLDPSLIYSDYQKFEECVGMLKSDERYTLITSEEILVIFDKKIGIDEINAVLNDFNLNRSKKWPGTYYHIQNIAVPKGTEYYWICKFKNIGDKIKSAGFDNALTTDV